MRITPELKNKVAKIFEKKRDEVSRAFISKRESFIEEKRPIFEKEYDIIRNTQLGEALFEVEMYRTSDQMIDQLLSKLARTAFYREEQEARSLITEEEQKFLILLSYSKEINDILKLFNDYDYPF